MKLEIEVDWIEDGSIDDELKRLVVSKMVNEIEEVSWKELRDKVSAYVNENLEARLAPMVEEVLSGPIQKTNEWGEPSGDPVTLKQLAVQRVAELTEKPRGYDNRNKSAPIEKMVSEVIDRQFQAEIKKAGDQAKAKVKAAVEKHGAKVLADMAERL